MQEREILLFGVPRVLVAGREVKFTRRRSIALLAYLAVARRRYERETLGALFWPEAGRSAGLAGLRQSLTDIRHNFAADVLLESRNWLELDPDIRCDVSDFERGLEVDSPTSLAKAVECSDSPFMDGFYLSDCGEFESWQDEERAYLGVKRELALERLIRRLAEQGSVREARHHLAILARESPDPDRTAILSQELEAVEHTMTAGAAGEVALRGMRRDRVTRLRDRIVFSVAVAIASVALVASPAGRVFVSLSGIADTPASVTVRAVAGSEAEGSTSALPAGHAVLTRSLERELTARISASPSLAIDPQSPRFIVNLSIESAAQGARCRVDLLHPSTGRHLWQRIYPLSSTPLEALDRDPELAHPSAADLARRITTALVQYLARSGAVPRDPTINPPI